MTEPTTPDEYDALHWEWQACMWQHYALTKRRAWWCGWRGMKPWPWIGSDEYWRYTLVLGPVVVALWRMPNWYVDEVDSRCRMEEITEALEERR